jgi:hypothetical protein
MTEKELGNTLQSQGEFINGMGGNGWSYQGLKVFVSISSHGMFKDKVCQIDTENPSHSILGIKVGESFDSAEAILKSRGFKEIYDDSFVNGDVCIYLFGGDIINRLRINIIDPSYKDVVF